MKLNFLLFFLTTTYLMANNTESFSQGQRVDINISNGSIIDVFNTIEEQSEFKIFYKLNALDLDKKYDVEARKTPVSDILENIFSGTEVSYEVIDKIIVITPVSLSQELIIKGKIIDANGTPLPGVNIVEKGTTNGAVTDLDGNYSIEVSSPNAQLSFSFIGYLTETVDLTGQTTIDITMIEDIQALDEVVVVGYGTMKRSDLTGAISSVSGDELAETKSANILEQAQGRLAGVDIVKNNGSPGAGATIRIRGNRSINASNNPLFVIDGIPTTQNIDDFNPQDIESIEVLKDASAVAIYGSRGANGVILITTKRGRQGKTNIEYNNYFGVKQAIENINKMNGQEYVEFVRVANGLSKSDNSQDVAILSQEIYDNYQSGVETDWFDEIFQTGSQQEHQLSVTGGSENLNYYLSGSYYLEEGVIKNTDFERFSLRTNIDGKINKKTKIGLSLSASTDVRNQMTNTVLNDALRYTPLVEPYDDKGNIIAYPDPNEGLVKSPLLNFVPNQYVDETKGYRFFSNLFGEYLITKDLTYRLNFGIDYKSLKRGKFTGDYDGSSSVGSIDNNSLFSYTLENILTFDKRIGEHNINVVGLFSTQKQTDETSGLDGRNIPITRSTFNDLGSAEEITGINSSISEWGLLSYMARVNYRFKDKYLVTVSGRSDGSSRLAEGNKWAFFPAASAAWIISEEDFMNIPVISFFKVRGGYGQVGNTAISPYQTLGGLSRTIYAFGDDPAFGYGHSGIANQELGWEVSKTTNIGIDFGLWNGRISGTLEYYNTNTENLLLERLLPITSGFTSVLENVGATRNHGWETTLSFNILNNNSGLRWDIDLNIFSNKEEIVELFNGAIDDVGNSWFIGEPINVFYDFKFDGIWQSSEADAAAAANQLPGDIKIKDVNGRDEEGMLTDQPDGEINSDDRTILGSTVPDWSGGITNKIYYKGFNFSMLIYTRQGQMLNSSLHHLGGNAWEGRHAGINFNYWTPENPSNEIPIPRVGGAPLYASSVRYYDGSFVKIKNITLGYDFSKNLLNLKQISSLQIYLSAINPIIFSEYDLVDPETSNGNVGVNNPFSTKTYMIGLNLKF